MANPEPFILRPTANPAEFAFVTYVRAQWDVDIPVPGVTKYADWKHCIYPQASGDYGGYVYADSVESPADWLGFLWVKRKTETEKNTPFRMHETFGNHRWPPEVRSIRFYQDPGFPRAINGPGGSIITGPTYYVRVNYIPEQNEGTRFVTKEFLSDTPFNIPQYPVPEPTSISYDVPGASGSFPECLHPKIVIPATRTATQSFTVTGGSSGASGTVPGQVFPATNFETRSPYFVSDEQQFTDGQWYRRQTQVFPPPELEAINR